MKITRIVNQNRLKNRYSVFVEHQYAFSLSEQALLDSGLAPGRELSNEELRQWKKLSADDKFYTTALKYAALRPRSTGEMKVYLQRKDAAPAMTDKILAKLRDIGLLDDAAFAKSFVANRRLLRPTSTRRLQQELRAKLVSEEDIKAALHDEPASDQSALLAVIAKKRNIPKYKAEPLKLMQYLARQGFSYDDIKTALSPHGEQE